MKRYEPTTNCENAVMGEDLNGDYIGVQDARRICVAMESLISEVKRLPKLHPQDPLTIALKKAEFIVRVFYAT